MTNFTDPNNFYGDFTGLGQLSRPVLNYIAKSHERESRINPIRCYLVQMDQRGVEIGSAIAPITVTSDKYLSTTFPMSFILWNGIGEHPDLRLYTHENLGGITILSDGLVLRRAPDVKDLRATDQFAIVKRTDLLPQRVEVHFYRTFDMLTHTIQYTYETMHKDVRPTAVNRPTENKFALFGWTQYKHASDAWRGANQILIRMPLTTRDQMMVNEEGVISIEENMCWMISTPYINDGDLILVPPDQSPTGETVWFEVVNKQDSIIQHVLVSQRFKVKMLPPEDERRTILVSTTYP